MYNAGSEWQDDIDGLADYYSTFFREYDPVIGRFNGVDPRAVEVDSWSVYVYSNNNPINFNDPLGDLSEAEFAGILNKLWNSSYGGHYSASDNTIVTYGDEMVADFFGALGAGGIQFSATDIRGDGSDFNFVSAVFDRYQSISGGDRNFKFVANNISNQVKADLNSIANFKPGAAVLALLDVFSEQSGVKINININSSTSAVNIDTDGGKTTTFFKKDGFLGAIEIKYFAQTLIISGTSSTSAVILSHELWHSLDRYVMHSAVKLSNSIYKYDPGTSLTKADSKRKFNDETRYYREARAISFENVIRRALLNYKDNGFPGVKTPDRYYYGKYNLETEIKRIK